MSSSILIFQGRFIPEQNQGLKSTAQEETEISSSGWEDEWNESWSEDDDGNGENPSEEIIQAGDQVSTSNMAVDGSYLATDGSCLVLAKENSFTIYEVNATFSVNQTLTPKGTFDASCEEREAISCIQCLPLMIEEHRRNFIAIGYDSGRFRIFSMDGVLIINQLLHSHKVSKLKVQHLERSGNVCDNFAADVTELLILFVGSTFVSIDIDALSSIVEACLKGSGSDNNDNDNTPLFEYHKYEAQDHTEVSDMFSCGSHTPTSYEYLVGNDMNTSGRSTRYIVVGNYPCIGQYLTGKESAFFSSQNFTSVASTVASVMFSVAKSYWWSGSGDNIQEKDECKEYIEKAVPLNGSEIFADQNRTITSATPDPSMQFVALTDNFGRVTISYLSDFVVFEIFKGYRQAQCAWIQSTSQDGRDTALFLIILAPLRSLLEIWTLWPRPRRVEAFSVSKTSKLLSVPYLESERCSVCFFLQDQVVYRLMVPFHLALEDNDSSGMKIFEQDNSVFEIVKEIVQSNTDFQKETMENILNKLSEIQSPKFILKTLNYICNEVKDLSNVLLAYEKALEVLEGLECDKNIAQINSTVESCSSLLKVLIWIKNSNPSSASKTKKLLDPKDIKLRVLALDDEQEKLFTFIFQENSTLFSNHAWSSSSSSTSVATAKDGLFSLFNLEEQLPPAFFLDCFYFESEWTRIKAVEDSEMSILSTILFQNLASDIVSVPALCQNLNLINLHPFDLQSLFLFWCTRVCPVSVLLSLPTLENVDEFSSVIFNKDTFLKHISFSQCCSKAIDVLCAIPCHRALLPSLFVLKIANKNVAKVINEGDSSKLGDDGRAELNMNVSKLKELCQTMTDLCLLRRGNVVVSAAATPMDKNVWHFSASLPFNPLLDSMASLVLQTKVNKSNLATIFSESFSFSWDSPPSSLLSAPLVWSMNEEHSQRNDIDQEKELEKVLKILSYFNDRITVDQIVTATIIHAVQDLIFGGKNDDPLSSKPSQENISTDNNCIENNSFINPDDRREGFNANDNTTRDSKDDYDNVKRDTARQFMSDTDTQGQITFRYCLHLLHSTKAVAMRGLCDLIWETFLRSFIKKVILLFDGTGGRINKGDRFFKEHLNVSRLRLVNILCFSSQILKLLQPVYLKKEAEITNVYEKIAVSSLEPLVTERSTLFGSIALPNYTQLALKRILNYSYEKVDQTQESLPILLNHRLVATCQCLCFILPIIFVMKASPNVNTVLLNLTEIGEIKLPPRITSTTQLLDVLCPLTFCLAPSDHLSLRQKGPPALELFCPTPEISQMTPEDENYPQKLEITSFMLKAISTNTFLPDSECSKLLVENCLFISRFFQISENRVRGQYCLWLYHRGHDRLADEAYLQISDPLTIKDSLFSIVSQRIAVLMLSKNENSPDFLSKADIFARWPPEFYRFLRSQQEKAKKSHIVCDIPLKVTKALVIRVLNMLPSDSVNYGFASQLCDLLDTAVQ